MERLFGLVEKMAGLELPGWLLGESGTGKEGLARALHGLGPRGGKSYEVVDCTLLGPEHFRSELFGHVKGAFTGAISTRIGRFEMAEGGTLFLDEIGDMPLPMQARMANVASSTRVVDMLIRA
mgnify:CR=1 FL=1